MSSKKFCKHGKFYKQTMFITLIPPISSPLRVEQGVSGREIPFTWIASDERPTVSAKKYYIDGFCSNQYKLPTPNEEKNAIK